MHYVAYLTSEVRCTKLSSLSVANKEVIGHSPNNCKDTKPPKDGIFSKIGMERDLAAGVFQVFVGNGSILWRGRILKKVC